MARKTRALVVMIPTRVQVASGMSALLATCSRMCCRHTRGHQVRLRRSGRWACSAYRELVATPSSLEALEAGIACANEPQHQTGAWKAQAHEGACPIVARACGTAGPRCRCERGSKHQTRSGVGQARNHSQCSRQRLLTRFSLLARHRGICKRRRGSLLRPNAACRCSASAAVPVERK